MVRRMVLFVVVLAVLATAVVETARHPEVTPLTHRWAGLVARGVLQHGQEVVSWTGALYRRWAVEGEGATGDVLVVPPVVGLDAVLSVALLRQSGFATTEVVPVSPEACREPGRVVATFPAGGTTLDGQERVLVFVCGAAATPAAP